MTELRRHWPRVLEDLKARRKFAWMTLSQFAQVTELLGSVLWLTFSEPGARDNFSRSGGEESLRAVIADLLGVNLVIRGRIETDPPPRAEGVRAAMAAAGLPADPPGLTASGEGPPPAPAVASARPDRRLRALPPDPVAAYEAVAGSAPTAGSGLSSSDSVAYEAVAGSAPAAASEDLSDPKPVSAAGGQPVLAPEPAEATGTNPAALLPGGAAMNPVGSGGQSAASPAAPSDSGAAAEPETPPAKGTAAQPASAGGSAANPVEPDDRPEPAPAASSGGGLARSASSESAPESAAAGNTPPDRGLAASTLESAAAGPATSPTAVETAAGETAVTSAGQAGPGGAPFSGAGVEAGGSAEASPGSPSLTGYDDMDGGAAPDDPVVPLEALGQAAEDLVKEVFRAELVKSEEGLPNSRPARPL
ncbi:MAG: hypothetical protein LBI84_10970 [Propionibacteriaceae bacterium]|nr:hypothetical protein [Propionibacteriaceae bacterium]